MLSGRSMIRITITVRYVIVFARMAEDLQVIPLQILLDSRIRCKNIRIKRNCFKYWKLRIRYCSYFDNALAAQIRLHRNAAILPITTDPPQPVEFFSQQGDPPVRTNTLHVLVERHHAQQIGNEISEIETTSLLG